MSKWLLALVIIVWIGVGGLWWVSQDRDINVNLNSKISFLEMEIKEHGKFIKSLAEIGLVGEKGSFSNIEWIVTDQIQERIQVEDGDGEKIAFSLDFRKNLIKGKWGISVPQAE
jgi:hypothetical protein